MHEVLCLFDNICHLALPLYFVVWLEEIHEGPAFTFVHDLVKCPNYNNYYKKC